MRKCAKSNEFFRRFAQRVTLLQIATQRKQIPPKMTEQAARLQTHNQEMVKCLNQLRGQQTALEEKIAAQERKKDSLSKEMEKLQRTLEQLETSIAEDTKALNDCSKRLTETENGYAKVVDTLQLLLMSAKEKVNTTTPTSRSVHSESSKHSS
ncbi:13 kDa deflagellation-inducible protein-like isoform X2 [Anopheles arabiensis]|uniref:13 kDa deflagellation-inducible protein-like isoform X2 n=1 Tax=Anopheles arabiensis TaxID=7173 RepID=UPI001AAD055D|nr:13 kDa deflagellation-inducible protein-like isoform X2 [Anopheles arabiensis]